jgi:hypothetical protein
MNIVVLALIVGIISPAIAQQDQAVISLERTTCFGACPAYLLRIDSSGAVSFQQGPPSNRHEERTSQIPPEQFADLMAGLISIHFFELNDVYKPIHTDGRQTYIQVTLAGTTKRIAHFENGPSDLRELERKIEVRANTHQWLHGDARGFTLESPVAGPQMGGGEDLKNERFVREDVYTRIKLGMNLLMEAAGLGNVAAIQAELQRGENVNTADETGWTALMIAAAMGRWQSVLALLDAGALVDQRDLHGDTALLGAAAVRFGNLPAAAETIRTLLTRGASVEAANDRGETALMWAARAGNPASIQELLRAGAHPARVDRFGHDALFYLRNARANLTFDKSLVERYDQAEAVLQHKVARLHASPLTPSLWAHM